MQILKLVSSDMIIVIDCTRIGRMQADSACSDARAEEHSTDVIDRGNDRAAESNSR